MTRKEEALHRFAVPCPCLCSTLSCGEWPHCCLSAFGGLLHFLCPSSAAFCLFIFCLLLHALFLLSLYPAVFCWLPSPACCYLSASSACTQRGARTRTGLLITRRSRLSAGAPPAATLHGFGRGDRGVYRVFRSNLRGSCRMLPGRLFWTAPPALRYAAPSRAR